MLQHGRRMIDAGVPFFGLGLEDCHGTVATFWLVADSGISCFCVLLPGEATKVQSAQILKCLALSTCTLRGTEQPTKVGLLPGVQPCSNLAKLGGRPCYVGGLIVGMQ